MTVNKNEKGKTKKFTKRQEAFINAAVNPNTRSGAEAARIAGIDKKNAKRQAHRWSTNDHISEEIKKRKNNLAKMANVEYAAVIGSAVRSAFASIDDAFDDDGNFSMEKARATGAIDLIKSITRSPGKYGETVKVEFYSSADARKELADYLGLKQLPRENEQNLKRTIAAIEDYLSNNPTADKEWVINEFAAGRNVAIEGIYQHFGVVKVQENSKKVN
ncbi:MAG: terminase small subunit [Acidobacteriota bacterium]|jgi:hypothetical protein|nr:terminase small subunit [Acidobacteriota bacterium]